MKPPILSEEQIRKAWCKDCGFDWMPEYVVGNLRKIAQAQLDAYEPLIQQAKAEVAREIIKLIDSLENNEEAFVDDVDFRNPSSRGKPLWDIEGMYKHLEAHKQTYKKIKEAIESKYGGQK